MTGTEAVDDVAVILAALVFIANQQRDRRAGGFAFIHTGENLDGIGFLALSDVAGSAGLAAIQLGLYVGFGQRHARGAAINHTTDCWAM